MNKRQRFDTKEEQLSYYLVVVSCICMLINLYALPHKISLLVSISNRTLLFLWIFVVGFFVIRRLIKVAPRWLSCFFVILAFSLFSLAMAGVIKPDQIISNTVILFNFLALPIMLVFVLCFTVPTRVKPVLLLANFGASLLYISLYHSKLRNAYNTHYGVRYLDSITLGYANPNQTAMYLFVCAILLLCTLFCCHKKLQKMIVGLDFLYISYMLYQTKSRTAILLLVFFVVIVLLSRKSKLSQAMVNVVLIVPLIYVVLGQFLLPYLENITVLGEGLFTGRESIYDRYFSNLSLLTFVFGDFNKFVFQNLHNGYISIAATAGIVVLISFIILLKKSLSGVGMIKYRGYEKAAVCGFLCIILYTTTEAAFLVGSVNYAYLIFTVYMLFSVQEKRTAANLK